MTLLRTCALGAALLLTACGGEGEADASPPDDANGNGPDVVVIGAGEALVTWDAPTTRADGTELTSASIGGYRVHYGTAPRTYDSTIDVGMADRATVSGLEAGQTYYFAVTAYDLGDRESEYSDEATKEL